MEENHQNITGNNPLVSIIVITYNSSKYVLETLESAKAQTYQNIELIVSDDCSSDNTLEICRSWLNENQQRFKRVELVTSEKNTGIAPNCNRGLKAAKGEWVKLIAGDDILLTDCINLNILEAERSDYLFFFSKLKIRSPILRIKISKESLFDDYYKYFLGNQFNNLINYGYFFPTPTFFFNLSELLKIGLFNEKYNYQEDFPMWFKILKNGYRFGFINEYTVIYRIHDNSIYNNKFIVNKQWLKSFKKFFYAEFLPELIAKKKYAIAWDRIVNFIYLDLCVLLGNKKNIITNSLKVLKIISPLYIYNYLNKFMKKQKFEIRS